MHFAKYVVLGLVRELRRENRCTVEETHASRSLKANANPL